MKIVRLTGLIVTLLALLSKLFVFEFVVRDDPTVGLALRAAPSLVSRQVVQHSPGLILIQSENDFLGSGLYNNFASWGWIVLLAGGVALLVLPVRRSRQSVAS